MTKKIDITKEWLEEHYSKQKLSVIDCATLKGCAFSTVARWIHRYHIPMRPRAENMSEEALREYYINKHMGTPTCARLLGCSGPSVIYNLQKYGIPIRDKTAEIPIKRDWLIQHYITDGLSAKECGDIVGCSSSVIFRSVKRFGLPRHTGMPKCNYARLEERIKRGEWGFQTRDVSGANSPRWRGGISFEPYCPKFNPKFKEHIREKFNRTCYLCGTNDNKKRLFVHHIDYNKNSICNGHEWAFVPLCGHCHSITNGRRWFWFNLLIGYYLINPEIHFNSPELYYDDNRSRCNSISPSKNRPVGADIGRSDGVD